MSGDEHDGTSRWVWRLDGDGLIVGWEGDLGWVASEELVLDGSGGTPWALQFNSTRHAIGRYLVGTHPDVIAAAARNKLRQLLEA